MTAALRAWQATLPAPPKTTPTTAAAGKARTPKPRAKGEGTAKPTPDLAAAFKRWDTNQDSALTLEEYTNGLAKKENAPQRFKNFDKNSDGKVTVEEFTNR